MDDFAGKSIIVTGGAQGIGRGIVLYLLERNCQVIVSDIDMEAGLELIEHLAMPDKLLFVHTDVGEEKNLFRNA